MSKILVIKPPVEWAENGLVAVLGDEQMFYRERDGELEARTVELDWRESSFAGSDVRTLADAESFYVNANDTEKWRSEYITEGDLDAILRAG